MEAAQLPDDEVALLHAAAPSALPSVLDLSSNMPPVGDQGAQGSCVGWATAYALKTSQELREEAWSVSVKAHQFSPAWVYNQVNGGEDQGALISDALTLIVKKGADTLDRFPYSDHDFKTKPDAPSFSRAGRYRASRWATVKSDALAIKKLLAAGRALVIGIRVYQEFMVLTKSKPVYESIRSGRLLGGHALCLMGYDDTRRAFKFINSWGKTWGTNGYGYLTYDFVKPQGPIGFQAYLLYDKANL
ncbi:MAG: C1 family peptidase [Spirochaetes bacterium]|nr:C1 family peptidase [Spirochaetota bacterium]